MDGFFVMLGLIVLAFFVESGLIQIAKSIKLARTPHPDREETP